MIKIDKSQVHKAISELISLRIKLFVTFDMLSHIPNTDLEVAMIEMIITDVDEILESLGFDPDTLPERFSKMASFLDEQDYDELQDVLDAMGEDGNFDVDEWLHNSSKKPN